MNAADLHALGTPALWAASFLIALVSGLIPFVISIEVYLVAVAAFTDASPVAIVGLTTAGQMLAKYILYRAGQGAINVKWIKRNAMAKATEAFERRPGSAMAIVAVSSLTGFPPLYGVALVAGALRVRLPMFLVVCTIGRIVRFGACYWAPSLFQHVR